MRSNANNSALIEMISSDILTYSIFPFLVDNPKELVEYMLVSRGFHQAADHPSVWKALAIRRYGETITQATEQAIQERQLYTSLKEAILKDDNVQLAIPTIREPKACDWAFNRHDSLHWHYCCIVQGIKWIRSSDFSCMYISMCEERAIYGLLATAALHPPRVQSILPPLSAGILPYRIHEQANSKVIWPFRPDFSMPTPVTSFSIQQDLLVTTKGLISSLYRATD